MVNKNIIGQTFWKWEVQEEIKIKGKTKYKCICNCDNKTEKILNKYDLINNKTTHCKKCTPNIYITKKNYMVGITKKNEKFIFDKDDYDLIKDISWNIQRGYVVGRKNNKSLRLHRYILESRYGDLKFEEYIDHLNKDKLDNRKINLKICSSSENKQNANIYKNNTSGTTGVNWDEKRGKWRSRICLNYQQIDLGFFDDINDAIKARVEAEVKYFSYKQEIQKKMPEFDFVEVEYLGNENRGGHGSTGIN